MPGLYGTLNLGTRALQAQSQGMSVAGQNLANVNNPSYSRQRLVVQTTSALQTPYGSEGTGVEVVGIERVRDALLDRQVVTEGSAGGFWTAQQAALRSTQAGLGEALDSSAQGTGGASATTGAASTSSLGSDLSALFNEFQNVAATPNSLSQRATLMARAQNLADQFNRADQRLSGVQDTLNRSITGDVGKANGLLESIAQLNDQIRRAEGDSNSTANDLRDRRQEKLESLAHITNFDSAEDSDGQLNISVSGQLLVSGKKVEASLSTQDDGNGKLMVRTNGGVPLALTGGSIQGTIDARDGALADARTNLDKLASSLASEVNTVHKTGYNLSGGTGADFFTGTSASTLRVNPALVTNPGLIQASSNPAASGDNKNALALARLADRPIDSLGQQTFAGAYGNTITSAGQSLANANSQVEDQQLVDNMLTQQRNSTSGVSIDEEMSDLVRYQKAFQASARIISIVDQMLDEIIQLKR